MKTTLQEIRGYLADPARWTKGATARDKNGVSTSSQNPSAICHCIFGAVLKFKRFPENRPVLSHLNALAPGRKVIKFNDDPRTTHADVLAFLDLAIEKAV